MDLAKKPGLNGAKARVTVAAIDTINTVSNSLAQCRVIVRVERRTTKKLPKLDAINYGEQSIKKNCWQGKMVGLRQQTFAIDISKHDS